METIAVFVADSYPLFRQAIQQLISVTEGLTLAGVAGSYENLSSDFDLSLGGILLIDLAVEPQKACLSIRDLKKKVPGLGIIAIDIARESNYLRTGFQHQADGFLLKTVESFELLEAIRTVALGGKYIQRSLREEIHDWLLQMNLRKKNETRLTKREKEVLHLIVEEHTTKEIADRLFVSLCTIETHRLHLISKLGVKNTAGLVREAIHMRLYQPDFAFQ